MDNVLSIAFCFWRYYARGRRQIQLCIFAFCLFLLYQRICMKGLIKMSLLEIDGLTHSFGENVLYKNAGFLFLALTFLFSYNQRKGKYSML